MSSCRASEGWIGAGRRGADSYSITVPRPPVPSPIPVMGNATAPNGHVITIDSQSLRLNGQPWVLSMGEMQFERIAVAEWEPSLRRMKAGGIQVSHLCAAAGS